MATSKAKKRKKRQQAQRRQQHSTAKAHAREAEGKHEHLPRTGTEADDAYLLRRSREDLVDFGLTQRKRGWVNAVIVVTVLVVLGFAIWGLLLLTL
jgi:hypothetical protein